MCLHGDALHVPLVCTLNRVVIFSQMPSTIIWFVLVQTVLCNCDFPGTCRVKGGMTQGVNFPCSLSFLAQVPCSLFFFLASSLFPFLFPGRVPSSLKNVILFPNYFGQCSQFPQFFGSIFPVPVTLSPLPIIITLRNFHLP